MAGTSSSTASLSGQTANENAVPWLDSLPRKSLFSHLREKGSDAPVGNMMCTIKENLFVWSQEELAVLTMNLKRLCASPSEDIFQTLLWTLPDFPDSNNPLLNLVPEDSGRYIALHCRRGLAVIKLQYHRGEHGEFSGGGKSVLCRAVQVAGDIFTINDSLLLVQISWCPHIPDTLALLTSDNFIRLFQLAEPNLPILQLPLFSPSSIHFYPNTIKLEECTTAFRLWNNSAFVFHDSGDVSLVALSQDPNMRTLSMHPQDDGNYICISSSMLLLETTPLAVILAGKSEGDDLMVCHCLYLEDSDTEGLELERASRDNERLYVVESICIKSNDSDKADSDFTLFPDPANPHGYFVRHPEGVHAVHMPWLRKLERFTDSDMSTLVYQAECQVNYLLGTVPGITSLQGVSVVWEPRLGYALVGLTSGDLECLTLALDERTWGWEDGELRADYVDWAPPDRTLISTSPQRSSTFMKTIEDILRPSADGYLLSHKRAGKDTGADSQADCLQYLMTNIKHLRQTYIIRQQHALKETERRISTSKRLKEQIISDIAELRDSADIIQEESERLHDKMKRLVAMNKFQLQRVKRLACRVESRSPLISEAEDCMRLEVEGVRDHIKTMSMEILNDKGRLKLCLEMDSDPKVDLNASQCSSLLKRLTDNADKIKTMVSTLQNLGDAMRT